VYLLPQRVGRVAVLAVELPQLLGRRVLAQLRQRLLVRLRRRQFAAQQRVERIDLSVVLRHGGAPGWALPSNFNNCRTGKCCADPKWRGLFGTGTLDW
jgi:hypothetical protein